MTWSAETLDRQPIPKPFYLGGEKVAGLIASRPIWDDVERMWVTTFMDAVSAGEDVRWAA